MKALLFFVLLVGALGNQRGHPDHVGIQKWARKEDAPLAAMTLTMLTSAVTQGAMCLDGTPTGYYMSAATNASNANDWQIYFEGGGWCYSEADCYGRSKTALGSSTTWAQSVNVGGVMSDDCKVNPDFCQWNRVYLPYCDGNSFSGNRDAAVVYNGTNLWFRGKRNMDATFQALNARGLNKAANVVLTGCSAGGLATYLHTDYVGTLIPSTAKYAAIPISGFFLLHNTVEGKPVYPNEIQSIFNLANSTHGVNDACIANKTATDQWQCNFATETYKYIKNRIFPLDSDYDSWQTSCILTSEPVNAGSSNNGNCSAAPGWQSCGNDPNQCTNDQMTLYNQYGMDFVSMMNGTATAKANGNGGFIYSCHTHCAGQTSSYYNTFAINGVTMQQAVSKWWASQTSAAPQWGWPCYYSATTTPRQCNPTCGST